MRKISWSRARQPTPVFLPGESRGQRSLAEYSPWGCKESDTTERLNTAHSTAQRCLQTRERSCFISAHRRDGPGGYKAETGSHSQVSSMRIRIKICFLNLVSTQFLGFQVNNKTAFLWCSLGPLHIQRSSEVHAILFPVIVWMRKRRHARGAWGHTVGCLAPAFTPLPSPGSWSPPSEMISVIKT